jgi:hypothetical protein
VGWILKKYYRVVIVLAVTSVVALLAFQNCGKMTAKQIQGLGLDNGNKIVALKDVPGTQSSGSDFDIEKVELLEAQGIPCAERGCQGGSINVKYAVTYAYNLGVKTNESFESDGQEVVVQHGPDPRLQSSFKVERYEDWTKGDVSYIDNAKCERFDKSNVKWVRCNTTVFYRNGMGDIWNNFSRDPENVRFQSAYNDAKVTFYLLHNGSVSKTWMSDEPTKVTMLSSNTAGADYCTWGQANYIRENVNQYVTVGTLQASESGFNGYSSMLDYSLPFTLQNLDCGRDGTDGKPYLYLNVRMGFLESDTGAYAGTDY